MICTFYSYKGGVGRSMAMANVADVLARRGKKVLIVDFDLEAPGLEQFFHINHDGVRRHPGLLDLLLSYKQAMSVARPEDLAFRRIENFICPVYERLPGGGRLDIMPAGQRQDPEQLARYAMSLRTFDWQDFYFDWEGGLFFEWLRHALVPDRYDLVLVDSRTGVTEMGGICGYQLADAIVMLCSANHQNVLGTSNMLRDFRSPAVEGLRRGRALDIVIVPARIEQRDPELLEEFFQRFEHEFGGLLPEALRREGIGFRSLTIPYEPQFAFEERIVSDPAQVKGRQRIADVFVHLADAVALLTNPAAAAPKAAEQPAASTPPPPAVEPAPLQYDAAKRFADYDVFLDAGGCGREQAEAVARDLQERGYRVFLDREGTALSSSRQAVMEQALFHSRALLYCAGASVSAPAGQQPLDVALKARERGQDLAIVPVLLPGMDPTALVHSALSNVEPLDLRAGYDDQGRERVHRAVQQALSSKARVVEAETRQAFPGARPFAEADSDLYFGRTEAVKRLTALTLEQPVITVVGPSGCGKTSLVHAGLIPALRAGAGGRGWSVVHVRPGQEPLLELVEALRVSLRRNGAEAWAREQVAAALRGSEAPRKLIDALARAAHEAAPSQLLIFIDPFEDIFTKCEAAARNAFVEALAVALESLPPGLRLVFALRSSFLGAVRQLEALWKRLEPGVFAVPPLDQQELRRAVEEPVERVGAAFEPGLVDRIVAEMQGEPAALPLLQTLLHRLWQERRDGWLTNEAFARANGLRGVLAAQAEDIYAHLADGEKNALRWIMLRLVRTGRSGEDTRRRLPLEQLLPAGAAEDAALGAPYRAAAKAMVEAGLLISSDEDGRRMIEPAHESLVRGWQRLREWLDAERAFLLWRERLGLQVAEWRKADRAPDLLLRGAPLAEAETWSAERGGDLNGDERDFVASSRRHGTRKQRRTTAAFGMAAAVFLALAVVALFQLRDARRQRNLAERQRVLAESRLQIAEDTIAQLKSTTQTLQTLAESHASAASSAEEKRLQAERALRQIQGSLAALEIRVEKSRRPDYEQAVKKN